MIDREILAQWMMENSFATGHGDTIQDLLAQLAFQIREKKAVYAQQAHLIDQLRERAKIAEARVQRLETALQQTESYADTRVEELRGFIDVVLAEAK